MAKKKREHAPVEANLTPMIDMTFQLIIFFILAGQMANDALAKLTPPKPHVSQALEAKELDSPGKVIVNVVPKTEEQIAGNPADVGKADHYMISGKKIPSHDYKTLLATLKTAKERSGEQYKETFYVEVRADKDVRFGDVKPVMQAAAEAMILKMNISALTATNEVQ